jgi:hypothetical protein
VGDINVNNRRLEDYYDREDESEPSQLSGGSNHSLYGGNPYRNYGATALNYLGSAQMIEPWPAVPRDRGAVHSTK